MYQKKYTEKFIEKFNMSNADPAKTPAYENAVIEKEPR